MSGKRYPVRLMHQVLQVCSNDNYTRRRAPEGRRTCANRAVLWYFTLTPLINPIDSMWNNVFPVIFLFFCSFFLASFLQEFQPVCQSSDKQIEENIKR